jgi:meso-butanediol dehydrogenase/(S,S)-butanediol dehydrogenase/diacetyl reductase
VGRVEGKRAIVTGGGGGIGRATVMLMVEEGARVVVADIDVQRAATAADEIGPGAAALACDVADPADVVRLFDAAEECLGGLLDVVVNNAGIEIDKDILTTSEDDWRRTIDVNLSGVFHGSRELVRRALAAGRPGAIVNTASVNGFYADAGIPAYCASKGAVIALTRAIAIDHGRAGIRANSICPGWVDTGLAARYLDAQPNPDEARRRAGDLHALSRIGLPEEIAQVAVFLASDDASFITGSAFVVDGGMTIGQKA